MRAFISYLQRFPDKTRSLIFTVLYGLSGGITAVVFQILINLLFNATYGKLSHLSWVVFLIGSFAVIVASSLAVGFLLNTFCRDAAGSGIPQVKLAFWKDMGFVPGRIVWVKFVAGILAVGGGSSLGREGPSVHVAAGVASTLSGWLGLPKQKRRAATAAGSAAGLAAAFNTPLAAITFVLEEIIGDLNSRLLGGILLASVIGAFAVHALVGKQPSFLVPEVQDLSWSVYLAVPLVAVFASLMGVLFQRSTLILRAKVKSGTRLPPWLHPLVGGLTTWVLGVAVFLMTGKLGVFGLGYDDLSAALHNQIPWQIAGVLLVTKLIASICSYGWGGCGGIFSPTLFFGGMSGIFMAGILNPWFSFSASDYIVLAIVGMSSCFGAVVRVPMTVLLIVFEMTHQFSIVPALMLGTLISQALGYAFNRQNFYDSILTQDGHNIHKIVPPRDLRSWQNFSVATIVNRRPVVIRDLAPANINRILQEHPYLRFPVELNGKIAGVVLRREAAYAGAHNQQPALEKAVTCLETQTIRDIADQMIASPSNMVLVVDQDRGAVTGVITMHDLLRSEVAIAERN
ncbi:MAG: chloride channel protein [Verrucomicrobia bacterium]|nr:chloride channel protein [Verrucomicrobiota bacterium]MBU4247204.1 chloride channel protein [Verrucomicrobiota bacterium]MBU4291375.1 chloride channel protein [Verrucomicrobiota bacterium]MBU4497699.1 chloride channel protein [Verrucomicrobiota bacterium]MCG2680661.1 chloride channel protein [Kiritimatiellia bacterium]